MTQIEMLAGGHARLLRLIFELWRSNRPGDDNLVATLVQQSDIRDECRRIFQGLHEEEQALCLRLVHGQPEAEDLSLIDHLVRRGLLNNEEARIWFSPLFAEFLRTQSMVASV
jgi:hypothetical protein